MLRKIRDHNLSKIGPSRCEKQSQFKRALMLREIKKRNLNKTGPSRYQKTSI